MSNQLIIITAPSGSGKTSIVQHLLAHHQELEFSISAATRPPRANEIDGKDYYFISVEAFRQKIENDEFAEWEMVYEGKYYGTLHAELQRIWDKNKIPVVDIDVQGALNVKKKYPDNSLSIFIKAPSIEELKQRLINRGTETPETLAERVNKAEQEMSFAEKFDKIIINDNLDKARHETMQVIVNFLHKKNED